LKRNSQNPIARISEVKMPKKMEIMRYICYIISLVSLKKFYKIYFIKVDRNMEKSKKLEKYWKKIGKKIIGFREN
jgi:hypothetical protein